MSKVTREMIAAAHEVTMRHKIVLGHELLTEIYQAMDAKREFVELTDEQILSLVPGLQDCLCDPWDYNNSGDYYASIPKDMIRLARAIEAAHGIKENT